MNVCATKDNAYGLRNANRFYERSATKDSASGLQQANSSNTRRGLTVLQVRRMCR